MINLTAILILILLIIIIWCLMQLEGVFDYVYDNPKSFYIGVLFFINIVATPMWLGTSDTGHYHSIIVINMVAIFFALIVSIAKWIIQKFCKDSITKFVNFLNNKEREEIDDAEWNETFADRESGKNKKTYDNEAFYEEGLGNVVGEYSENIYDEAGGNTESGSEQNNFSKTENSKGIKHQNQSEMDEKTKNKDVKQIVYNQENTVIKDRKTENVKQYKKN